jgi:FkbM family methyltransferase
MINIIRLIYSHPLNKGKKFQALYRFFLWQIISRVYKHPILLPFTDKSSYLCWNGLMGLTGNWYYGLMELKEMSFLLHFIRDEDCFFDIGANVGAFTILASQHSSAVVHSFEPHPQTFKYLVRNIKIQDKTEKVYLHNLALGDTNALIEFTCDLDTTNHVAIDKDKNNISVESKSINSLKITSPNLIKIDVEGFEFNVLKGATNILENLNLKAIIIELNGSGLKFGISDDQIDELLRSYSFSPFTYDPFNRSIIELNKYTTHNTIYIRDLTFCKQRVLTGKKVKLSNGVEI